MATIGYRFGRIINHNSLQRSLHIQRRYIRSNLNIKHTLYQNVRRNPIDLNYHHMRRIGHIPPIILYLLRSPLARPILIMIGGFIGGVILQILGSKRTPQWLLSATSESSTASTAGNIGKYSIQVFGGGILLMGLYLTRLRNPIYVSFIGSTETNLQLANEQAKPQWNAMWDSRSANDSMKTRLTAMENYLGEAIAASADNDSIHSVQQRVDKIREKGYTNAIKVALDRAEFWAESGETVKFEQTLQQLNKYKAEGGVLDVSELERIQRKAYGTRCSKLLANAQTFSNKGDVSNCQKSIGEINQIQNKLNGVFIENDKLDSIIERAHQHHVRKMLSDAQKVRENGSRKQAKLLIQQAEEYSNLHHVTFDSSFAEEILS